MKTNAIIRIILFCTAIVLLLGILLTVILGQVFSFVSHDSQVVSSQVPATCFDPDEITEIDIEWAAGNVTISPADVDEISLYESTVSSDSTMVCTLSGTRLTIKYQKDTSRLFGISLGRHDTPKDLTITVPESWICQELDIDSAAADVDIRDLTITNISISAASGICDLQNCTVGKLDIDTVSGDVRFSGTLDSLDCEAVSADCTVNVSNAPRSIELDSISGKLDLTVPVDCGFTLEFDTLSGQYESDFPLDTIDGKYVHGDGSCRINTNGVSGDISIRKAK